MSCFNFGNGRNIKDIDIDAIHSTGSTHIILRGRIWYIWGMVDDLFRECAEWLREGNAGWKLVHTVRTKSYTVEFYDTTSTTGFAMIVPA